MTEDDNGQHRIVHGRVTRHEPYGFFVDIGEGLDGLVVVTMVSDDPEKQNPAFPPVGSEVSALLLGYSGPRRQPRLSIRPKDVAARRMVT